MANHSGVNNPNWKGGRTVDPRGYVLIRVGVGHHLADVRGYAYEHRLIAEEKLGRPLMPGEEVHHETENPSVNDPDKLKVARDHAEHGSWHRKREDLRPYGAENPEIECACGCGARFLKYDSGHRPRRYISGHNGKSGRDGRWVK